LDEARDLGAVIDARPPVAQKPHRRLTQIPVQRGAHDAQRDCQMRGGVSKPVRIAGPMLTMTHSSTAL